MSSTTSQASISDLGSFVDKIEELEQQLNDERDTKITELEAENKRLTAELETKGKAFDHLRAAVLDAAKAVTGPVATPVATPVKLE